MGNNLTRIMEIINGDNIVQSWDMLFDLEQILPFVSEEEHQQWIEECNDSVMGGIEDLILKIALRREDSYYAQLLK